MAVRRLFVYALLPEICDNRAVSEHCGSSQGSRVDDLLESPGVLVFAPSEQQPAEKGISDALSLSHKCCQLFTLSARSFRYPVNHQVHLSSAQWMPPPYISVTLKIPGFRHLSRLLFACHLGSQVLKGRLSMSRLYLFNWIADKDN
jgi:hypothetical protein